MRTAPVSGGSFALGGGSAGFSSPISGCFVSQSRHIFSIACRSLDQLQELPAAPAAVHVASKMVWTTSSIGTPRLSKLADTSSWVMWIALSPAPWYFIAASRASTSMGAPVPAVAKPRKGSLPARPLASAFAFPLSAFFLVKIGVEFLLFGDLESAAVNPRNQPNPQSIIEHFGDQRRSRVAIDRRSTRLFCSRKWRS